MSPKFLLVMLHLIMRNECIVIDGVSCCVRGGGPRPQNFFVHNLPLETDIGVIAHALSKFGKVEDVYKHCWLDLGNDADGARVVCMIHNQAISRN